MNFWKYITLLIVSPGEGWKDIGKFTIPNNLLLGKLYYPCIGVLSLSSFIPFVIGYVDMQLQEVIMKAVIDFVKYFIAFFAVSYLLSGIYAPMFKSKNDVNKLNNFIAFNLAILVIFNVLSNLMPGFPFFEIFPLYIIYVVYRGKNYLSIPDERVKSFVSLASIFMLLIPGGIKFVLDILIPVS